MLWADGVEFIATVLLESAEPADVDAAELLALVRAAFDRVQGRDRLELVEHVGALVQQLDKSGLKAVIPPADLLRLARRGRGDADGVPRQARGERALPE